MQTVRIGIPKRIYCYTEPVNMCCSFNGLSKIVRTKMHKRPESGDLYVFCSRKMNYIKVFGLAAGGWTIIAKRLDAGAFPEEMFSGGALSINALQSIVDYVSDMRTIEAEVRKAA